MAFGQSIRGSVNESVNAERQIVSTSPTLLAFDSATTGCSVSVVRGSDVLAHDAREMARGQAEVLLPMAMAALKAAGLGAKDLDAVAVTRGPGAFTGMRIGLSAARAFALSLGVPCIGVTTLEAVAHGVSQDERQGRVILAAIESKRDDIYVQFFSDTLVPLCDPTAADGPALAARVADLVADNGSILIVGDASARAHDMLAGENLSADLGTAPTLPDTRIVASIAVSRLGAEKNAPPPEPLYLRPPDAKMPKNQGRARP